MPPFCFQLTDQHKSYLTAEYDSLRFGHSSFLCQSIFQNVGRMTWELTSCKLIQSGLSPKSKTRSWHKESRGMDFETMQIDKGELINNGEQYDLMQVP